LTAAVCYAVACFDLLATPQLAGADTPK